MHGLAVLLYVQQDSDSYAFAGAVSAGTLLGIALGMIGQGRLLDRVGPTRPLLMFSAAYLTAVSVPVLALVAPVGSVAMLAVVTVVAGGLITPQTTAHSLGSS